jgi:hypothetical protein
VSFNTLNSIQPGQTVSTTVTFLVPVVAVTNAAVSWSLLNSDGVLLSDGNSTSVTFAPANIGAFISVSADVSLTLPTNLPPTLENESYQVVYQLTCDELALPALMYDSIRVESPQQVMTGAQTCIHLLSVANTTATCHYVHPTVPTGSVINVDLYQGNVLLKSNSIAAASGLAEPDGVKFSADIDLTGLPASLVPFSVVWTVDGVPDVSGLFAINPSIHMAMKELHGIINKTNTDWQVDWITFVPEQLITYLLMGAGLFNAEHLPTNFNMLNAEQPVRNLWLTWSAIHAFRIQSFTGIQTDFQFSGASLNLDVDRASKFQSAAELLESSIKDTMRNLKTALAKKGISAGDGSYASIYSATMYQLGRIGVTLNPVGRLGPALNPFSWRSYLYAP